MSLQTRLSALITAIGADIKAINTALATVKGNSGVGTLTWPGGSVFSNTVTVAHGLAATPSGAAANAVLASGDFPVEMFVVSKDATNIVYRGRVTDGSIPATGTTRAFWWTAGGAAQGTKQQKVIDFDTGTLTKLSVTGLDGDAHRGYDIWLDYLYKNPVDNSPYFRSNPAPAATACNQPGGTMDAAGTTWSATPNRTDRTGTGIGFGTTTGGTSGRVRVLMTGRLLCLTPGAGNERCLFTGDAFMRPNVGASDKRYAANQINGFMNLTAALTALDFELDNSPAVGKLILTPIVGTF